MRRAWLMMGVAWMAQALLVDPIAFASDARPETTMWYTQPAAKWEEALPVGNGRLGAMVFGGVAEERLQLNEDSLWSGGPQDADNPEALVALPKIRELLFAGNYVEAQRLTDKTQVCKGPGDQPPFGSYSTLGELTLTFEGQNDLGEYRRELRLDDAIARVSYHAGGATHVRETFSSNPRQVLVHRITSDRPGGVSFRATLSRKEHAAVLADGENQLVMTGQLRVKGDEPGMRFAARLRAIAEGGDVKAANGGIDVRGANAVTLLLTAGTNYRDEHFEQTTADQLAASAKVSYDDLRREHVSDHRKLFGRVRLDLGRNSVSDLPTDQRLVATADGQDDPALIALYFNLGRYLLIGSSRPGDMAANLQGVWAAGLTNP